MIYYCPEHNKPMKESKFRDDEFWHKEEGMERACTKRLEDLKTPTNQVNAFKIETGIPSEGEEDDTMHKADWELKDLRIARLTLAKTFIHAGVDYDNAEKNNDLNKWLKWVWEGK